MYLDKTLGSESEQVREHAKKSIVDHLNLEKKKIHPDLSWFPWGKTN